MIVGTTRAARIIAMDHPQTWDVIPAWVDLKARKAYMAAIAQPNDVPSSIGGQSILRCFHLGPEYLEVLPSSGEPLVIFLPYSVAGIIAAGRYERSHRQRKEQTSEHWLRFKNSPPTNDGQRTNPQPNRCPATTRHSHFPLWWLIGPRFGGSPLMCHGRKALEHRTPRLGSSVRPRGIMVDPTS